MIYYVYIYLDLDNIPFYVGKGKSSRHRVSNHLRKDSPNLLLKNKIRKIGVDNIKIQFLHRNLTEEEAFQKERYWIKYYGRRDLGLGPLCNLTDGGEGTSGRIHSNETKRKIGKGNKGKKISKETRQKLSEAHKGQIAWNKGIPHTNSAKQKMRSARKEQFPPMTGKSHTKETKQKISSILTGKHHTEKTKQKMSKSHKGLHAGEKNPMYGKRHSEETKQKMRGSRKPYGPRTKNSLP